MKRNIWLFFIITVVNLTHSIYAQENELSQEWTVKESLNELNDEKRWDAFVVSKMGIKDGYIMVTCFENSGLEFKISTGQYLGNSKMENNVKYRIDKKNHQVTTMKAASNIVYSTNRNSRILLDMMKGNSILIQTINVFFQIKQAKFSLNGAKKKIRTVLNNCGIH